MAVTLRQPGSGRRFPSPPHPTNATHLATRSLYVHQTLAECPSQTVSLSRSTTRFTDLTEASSGSITADCNRYRYPSMRADRNETTDDSVHSTRAINPCCSAYSRQPSWPFLVTALDIPQSGCIEVVHHPVLQVEKTSESFQLIPLVSLSQAYVPSPGQSA